MGIQLLRSIGSIIFILTFSSFSVLALARGEAPQPQFQRSDWQSLNGVWELRFDPANEGIKQKWHSTKWGNAKPITVPFAPETELSGIHDKGFHPFTWYRRELEIPENWWAARSNRLAKHALLRFGAVDYRATVWVNGRLVGRHEGGHTPFHFDITPFVRRAAINTVTVRADDPPSDRSILRGKQYWKPNSEGIFYSRTSGIWQPVWLEQVGETHLERVDVRADLSGRVILTPVLSEAVKGLKLRARVSANGQVIAEQEASVLSEVAQTALQIAEPHPWSPEDPYLYDVDYELVKDSRVLDRVHSYFGIRSVEVKDGELLLNGKPLYLKMVLDQGYWPESGLTPPSDEALLYDIDMVLKMGFNGVRKHQKIEDPRFLYWADHKGLLVSGEMPNAQVFSPLSSERLISEFQQMVRRDFNHPSIIMWIPLNESWGVEDLSQKNQQDFLARVYKLARTLGSTRPATDNDGWQHTRTTDLFGLHDYAKTGDVMYSKYEHLPTHPLPGTAIPDNGMQALAPGHLYNGSPLWISEFGGIAYIPPGAKVPPEAWGYDGIEPTSESALTRMYGLFRALQRLPSIKGYCYTELTDVEQEINGLMTYDRKLKFPLEDIQSMTQLSPDLQQHGLPAAVPVPVQ